MKNIVRDDDGVAYDEGAQAWPKGHPATVKPGDLYEEWKARQTSKRPHRWVERERRAAERRAERREYVAGLTETDRLARTVRQLLVAGAAIVALFLVAGLLG
jgi:hypothetical protein